MYSFLLSCLSISISIAFFFFLVQFRVKPGPDPSRPVQETKWMTRQEIDIESMKATHSWINSGNGRIGKLYVEVLECQNLPNVISLFNHRVDHEKRMTDPFCCLVYEDAVVYTDVIRDATHPRWMPWSQRAFVFDMDHPSSNLMVGVFDFDDITGNHNPLGRVNINLTNLLSKTEYSMYFDLHKSAMLDNNRKAQGRIKVRIRVEFKSYELKALATDIKLPLSHQINLANKYDFKTVYYVCRKWMITNQFELSYLKSKTMCAYLFIFLGLLSFLLLLLMLFLFPYFYNNPDGDEDPNRFSLGTFYAYKDEIWSHYGHIYELRQAALVVIFWRGE